jgi:fucose 4-O-acetylase-like acetyltransferase
MPEEFGKSTAVRVAVWDNLKAVLIFLVVFAHLSRRINGDYPIMAGIFFFIYLFHMPAFIFVSGLFCKNAVKKHNYNRACSFLLLYLLVKFLVYLITLFISDDLPMIKLFADGGVSWYGLAMCLFLLMTMFFQRYHPAYMMVFAIVMGCLAGYCEDVGTVGTFSRVLVYYPFFLAGFYLKPEKLEKVTGTWYVRLAGLAVLIAAVWLCISNVTVLEPLTEFIKGKGSYESYLSDTLAPYGGLMRLGLYAVSFLLTFGLVAVTPRCHIPVVSTVGKRTLSVYAFHYPLVLYFYTEFVMSDFVLAHWSNHYILAYGVISLLIVLVFAAKPFDWLVTKLINPPLLTQKEERK